MKLSKQSQLYSGKAKSVYNTEDPNYLILEFRNDISAFNAVKLDKLTHKGAVNNQFNAHIMQLLNEQGIKTHFVEMLNSNESIVKRLDMIPVESIVRNRAAGSLCKRLGIEKGLELNPPLFEFCLKDDALGDPLISDDHIRTFNWASDAEIKKMREITFQVNEILSKLFIDAGFILVDFKLEFGRFGGELLLGDEFTPDGCRLWDAKTQEIFDKDRFRQDLGDVIEHYQIVAKRLGIKITTPT